MKIMERVRCWLGIKPPSQVVAERQEVREMVHNHRNTATNTIAEARRSEKVSSQAEKATRHAIQKLEAARRQRDIDDDRMAHPS